MKKLKHFGNKVLFSFKRYIDCRLWSTNHNLIIWTETVYNVRKIIKKNRATAALVIATFLNPLGFDAAFYTVMQWTNSYWMTSGIFYLGSASFFGLYFYLRRKDEQVESK
jgi:hypothetical protein